MPIDITDELRDYMAGQDPAQSVGDIVARDVLQGGQSVAVALLMELTDPSAVANRDAVIRGAADGADAGTEHMDLEDQPVTVLNMPDGTTALLWITDEFMVVSRSRPQLS